MPECNDSWVGRRLGKYHFTGRLGQGGMGVVYAAEDTVLKRRVAIKLLPEAVAADPEARRRFLREARAAARLAHPNVVTIHEADERDGVCYLVMELVAGGSAQDLLHARGALPWPEATRLLADACRGLAAAHAAGLIHRDIKPANLMRAADGAGKLAGFGLARTVVADDLSSTGTGAVMGTPHYMSPEQCRGEPLDARADLYALGATYYALLTGRPPYQRDDPLELMFAHCSQPVPDPRAGRPEVPEGSAAVVRRAMAKYPAERYRTAAEMLADLEALLATAPVKAGSASAGANGGQAPSGPSPAALTLTPAPTPAAPRRKRPLPRILLAGGGVALVLGLVVLLGAMGLFPWPPPAEPNTGEVRPDENGRSETATTPGPGEPDKGPGVRDEDRPPEVAAQPAAAGEKPRWTGPFRERITEKEVLLVPMNGRVETVAFSPDGKWLAAGCLDGDKGSGGLKVWDCATGEERYSRWQDKAVQVVAFFPDGRAVAAGTADGAVNVLDLATGEERRLPLSGAGAPPFAGCTVSRGARSRRRDWTGPPGSSTCGNWATPKRGGKLSPYVGRYSRPQAGSGTWRFPRTERSWPPERTAASSSGTGRRGSWSGSPPSTRCSGPWRSPPTGGPWPWPEAGSWSSGTPARARSRAPWGSRYRSSAWRSPPTAISWLRPSRVAW